MAPTDALQLLVAGQGRMALSDTIGYVSLMCWIVVMLPQIWMNYRRKSGEGVSVVMMVAWVIGDVFNIAGALMQGLVMSTILIGSYYLLVDSTLLFQIFYYRLAYNAHRKNVASDAGSTEEDSLLEGGSSGYVAVDNGSADSRESPDGARDAESAASRPARIQLSTVLALLLSLLALAILAVLLSTLVLAPVWDNIVGPLSEDSLPLSQIVAQAMGTASAIVYIMSYVPQAVQNYQRKSCEGLSIWLFLLSLLGNTTYALAIMVVSLDPGYLAPYVPWLMGALVPCIIQMVILHQFHTYPH
ncbi:putative vacuolar membrane transporter for cationic amino acids [Coemansia sp. RSA 552]|nr:putative vacuolar membrane transporter for cationic amino acids [Coemansia sp. RSA 552]